MSAVIDVSTMCAESAPRLAEDGVRTIIRYYSRDTRRPSKRLSLAEVTAFAAASLRIGIVHEGKRGDLIGTFTQQTGELDAAYCLDYGARVIRQPMNSAIYFAVYTDVSAHDIAAAVLPYFRGVRSVLSGKGVYDVGVYGSGDVCDAVLNAGLCEYAWLAQSTGWSGYNQFLASNKWTLKQLMPTKIAEVPCDPDEINLAAADIGDFAPPEAATKSNSSDFRIVTANAGLRLRAGPDVVYNVVRIVPYRERVLVLKTVGDWAQVDVTGDGGADGFVSAHYLQALG